MFSFRHHTSGGDVMKRKLLVLSFCLAAQYSRQTFAQSLLPTEVDVPISDDSEVFALQMAQSGLLAQEPDGFAKTPPIEPNLTYQGGPILSNVKVEAIYWGTNVTNPDHFNALYQMLTVSPLMAWLSEYNTPTQQVGFGSLVASVIDTDAPVLPTVHDDQIVAEISRLINTGRIPAGDENTLFAVHFAKGQDIQTQGVPSCVIDIHGQGGFSGYHFEGKIGSRTISYSVIADCQGNEDLIGKTAEHELIEAMTNPKPFSAPAWVDVGLGEEIADICSTNLDVLNGFVVQQMWSNQAHACITTKQPKSENDFAFTPAFVGGKKMIPGEVVSLPVATSITNGATQAIVLSVEGMPTGMTAEFIPAVIRSGDTAIMQLTVAPNTPITPAVIQLVIFGTGASVTHAAGSNQLIQSSLDFVTNGGFESGLAGWTVGDDQNPTVQIPTVDAHAFDGRFSLTLGSTSAGARPDSFVSMIIPIREGQFHATLSFWNQPATTGVAPDSFQEAQVLDAADNVIQTIFHETANHDWQKQTVDLSALAGQTVQIRFATHNGNAATATSMRLDDVSLVITPL
jgi:hypothetical protein